MRDVIEKAVQSETLRSALGQNTSVYLVSSGYRKKKGSARKQDRQTDEQAQTDSEDTIKLESYFFENQTDQVMMVTGARYRDMTKFFLPKLYGVNGMQFQ